MNNRTRLKNNKIISLMLARKTFITYVVIGILGLFWDMGLFILFYRILHTNYLFANFSAMVIAICHNFILNAFFNFKKTDGLLKRFLSFLSIGLVGVAVSETVMYILHDKLGLPAEIVKLGSLPVIATGQYLLNKRISFKTH